MAIDIGHAAARAEFELQLVRTRFDVRRAPVRPLDVHLGAVMGYRHIAVGKLDARPPAGRKVVQHREVHLVAREIV